MSGMGEKSRKKVLKIPHTVNTPSIHHKDLMV